MLVLFTLEPDCGVGATLVAGPSSRASSLSDSRTDVGLGMVLWVWGEVMEPLSPSKTGREMGRGQPVRLRSSYGQTDHGSSYWLESSQGTLPGALMKLGYLRDHPKGLPFLIG